MQNNQALLKLGLPSKGALEKDALSFLDGAGLRVYKPNVRQYSALIPALPGVEVVFQRVSDIFHKVQEGSMDLGITGHDIYSEYTDPTDDVIVVKKLGFGGCALVLAVPESWIDVSSITDLADLSVMYKDRGKPLSIATKFRNLTRDWLYDKSITNFSLVNAEGALEAAPVMGYADIIADLTATGTTLKENQLKTLDGGTILDSEAVLIANAANLIQDPDKLRITRHMLELTEANQRARTYASISANIQGDSLEQVGKMLVQRPELSGLIGPSIVEIFPKTEQAAGWYEVRIVIEQHNMLDTVEHLRKTGGANIIVGKPQYVFNSQSDSYAQLAEQLLQREESSV